MSHLYSLHGSEAAEQLFRVTAGLESMIVGEAEIQGQVKRAYELALVENATGPILNRLFRGALGAASGPARRRGCRRGKALSVPSMAELVSSASLRRPRLAPGSRRWRGRDGRLTAARLEARGVEAVFIANRRYDRAIGLAQRFGGLAIRFEELPEEMVTADIVVASTSSPHHVIELEGLSEVMDQRAGRPLLLVDLAVPRDIQPACRDIPGVTLYDMDDLQSLVERNASGRQAEALLAQTLLRGELSRFERWMATQDAVPTVAALRKRADDVVEGVLAENESRWESLSEADRERARAMGRAIASRLLHEPTLRLKRAASDDDAYVYVHALRELFGLDRETAPLSDADAEVRELRARREPQ